MNAGHDGTQNLLYLMCVHTQQNACSFLQLIFFRKAISFES